MANRIGWLLVVVAAIIGGGCGMYVARSVPRQVPPQTFCSTAPSADGCYECSLCQDASGVALLVCYETCGTDEQNDQAAPRTGGLSL